MTDAIVNDPNPTAANPTAANPAAADRLADARLYLCTDGRRERGDLADFLDAVLANGVDIVQLREKHLEAADELALLEVFADACRRHGALLAVNDRADLAVAAGADVLHLGQRDLPPATARRIVGPRTLIGLSSHSPAEAAAAAEAPEVDYYCLGPIWATPTKPGRPHTGLDAISRHANSRDTISPPSISPHTISLPSISPDTISPDPKTGPGRPWFAIGGIDEDNLDQVLAAGARRAVVVRVLTAAADPGAVAGRLATRLRAAGRAGAV